MPLVDRILYQTLASKSKKIISFNFQLFMKFSYVHFLFTSWLQIYLSWHIKFILCIYTEIPNTTTFHNIITSCNIYVAFSSESQLVSKPIKLSSFKSDFSFINRQHKCHQVVQQCIDNLITRNTWSKLPLGKLQNAWSLILKSSLQKCLFESNLGGQTIESV